MRVTYVALCCGLLACILGCLTGCDRSTDGPVLASAENVAPPGNEEGDDSVAALKDELKHVSERLHALEYPELRERDPREIPFLQARADAHELAFQSAKAEFDAGCGDSVGVATASYYLATARAELAWAKQDVHDAVGRLVEAAGYAADMVESTRQRYDQGLQQYTMESVVKAQSLLAYAEIRVIRAEKVAAAAKVDISDIATDPKKRVRKNPAMPPGVRPEPNPTPGLQPLPSPPGLPPGSPSLNPELPIPGDT